MAHNQRLGQDLEGAEFLTEALVLNMSKFVDLDHFFDRDRRIRGEIRRIPLGLFLTTYAPLNP